MQPIGSHSMQVRGCVQEGVCRMRLHVQVVCPGVKPHSAVCRGVTPAASIQACSPPTPWLSRTTPFRSGPLLNLSPNQDEPPVACGGVSAVISIPDGYSASPSLTHASHEHPNLRTPKERLWVPNLLDCEHEGRRAREERGSSCKDGQIPSG